MQSVVITSQRFAEGATVSAYNWLTYPLFPSTIAQLGAAVDTGVVASGAVTFEVADFGRFLATADGGVTFVSFSSPQAATGGSGDVAAETAARVAADLALQAEIDALGASGLVGAEKMVGIVSSPQVRSLDADLLALGVGWSRVELWNDLMVAGTPFSSVKAAYDAVGVRVFPLVNNYAVPFTDHASWIAAALAVAAVTDSPVLEIGNEPFQVGFYPSVGATLIGQYAAMVKAVSIAVRDATGRGCLAAYAQAYRDAGSVRHVYLPQLLAGAPDLFDHAEGIALHPYGDMPEFGMGELTTPEYTYTAVRDAVDTFPGMPVYLTEMGQALDNIGRDYIATPAQQADAVKKYYDDLQDIPDVKGAFLYRHCDFGASTQKFGVLSDQSDTFFRRPSWYRLRDASARYRSHEGLVNELANDGTDGLAGWTATANGVVVPLSSVAATWLPGVDTALRVGGTGGTTESIISPQIATFPGELWFFAAEFKGPFRNLGAGIFITWKTAGGFTLSTVDSTHITAHSGRVEMLVAADDGAFGFVMEVYDQSSGAGNGTFDVTEIMAVRGIDEPVIYFPTVPTGLLAAHLTSAAAIAVADSTDVVLSWDTVREASAGMFDVAHPSRITATQAGWHDVSASVKFESSDFGTRQVSLRVWRPSGQVYVANDSKQAIDSSQTTDFVTTAPVYLDAGDYVEVVVFQNHGGGPLNIVKAAEYSPEFTVVRSATSGGGSGSGGVGPAGPPGAAGATGPTGPAGSGGGLSSAITATVSPVAATETIVAQLTIPANTLAAGSSFEVAALGQIVSGTNPTLTAKLRLGTAGTTADAQVCAAATSGGSLGAVANAPLRIGALATIRTIGAGGTALGNLTAESTDFQFASAGSVQSSTVAINTTVQNILTLTVTTGGTTPVAGIYDACIQQVK